MLQEIALTPSVFHSDAYSSREECDAHLQGIWTDLLERLLVRDLRNGGWYKQLIREKRRTPHAGQKLLKQLRATSRLRLFDPMLPAVPESEVDWCREALESHAKEALSGVLCCKNVKREFRDNAMVASILQRNSSDWWSEATQGGAPRIGRQATDLVNAFSLVLRTARHVMFLDPHLDPERGDYAEFVQLLRCCCADHIEIHRVCYEGMGRNSIPTNEEWERRFRNKLGTIVEAKGFRLEVFIWSDEHDRHLVTNLASFHLGNGFAVTNSPSARMTCSRLSRKQSDSIQRDHDPQVNVPRHRFVIAS